MAGEKLTSAQITQRFGGQTVNPLEQINNDGSPAPITAANGSPNDAASPATVGVDVTNPIFAGFCLEPAAGETLTGRIWYLWKGEDNWHQVAGSESALGTVDSFLTDELKVRGVERVYFEFITVGANGARFKIKELL